MSNIWYHAYHGMKNQRFSSVSLEVMASHEFCSPPGGMINPSNPMEDSWLMLTMKTPGPRGKTGSKKIHTKHMASGELFVYMY